MASQPIGLRQRKHDQTRRALADAATRLFAERGYEDTTIADLAAAAEVSTRTFYSYFASKDDVLLADLNCRLASLAELEIRLPDESLLDAILRLGVAAVNIISVTAGDRRAAARARIIDRIPILQAAGYLRLAAAERLLAGRLCAAFPRELDDVLAAATVAALFAGLRASSRAPSRRAAQLALAKVASLLHNGLIRS